MYWHSPKHVIPEGLLNKLTKEQKVLQQKIILSSFEKKIVTIAGCDSALIGNEIFSVFVVFSFPSLTQVEVQYAKSPLTLPYIPGFLGFRELPNLVKAYEKLHTKPDITMVDGHGIMHPRKLGIATHLGVTLNIPTFGVAKKKLVGTFVEPGIQKGTYTNVMYKEEVIGVALRSKDKVKPIFVSAGHLCTLEDALNLTLQTIIKHKLPEPTRLADKYSKEHKHSAPLD